MVDQNLINYIRDQLARGYSVNVLRDYLIRYGYDPRTVDEAFRAIYTPPQQKSINAKNLILAVIFIIGIIGLVFTIINLKQSTPKLLDLRSEPVNSAVEPGDDLEFIVEITSQGSSKRYDVILKHELIELASGKKISTKEESTAIETSASKHVTIEIPGTAKSGKYSLRTEASYDDKKAVSSFTFQVVKKGQEIIETCDDGIKNQGEKGVDCGGPCKACQTASCNDNIKNQGEQGIDCGGPCSRECAEEPTCNDGIKNQGETGIDCGGPCKACKAKLPKMGMREILEKVKETAEESPEEAAEYCEQLSSYNKDSCYRIIAEESGNSNYCSFIESPQKKDSCYFSFILKDDLSVCGLIQSENLRRSCGSMGNLAQVSNIIGEDGEPNIEELKRLFNISVNLTQKSYDKIDIIRNGMNSGASDEEILMMLRMQINQQNIGYLNLIKDYIREGKTNDEILELLS
ncbi:hypothetical protein D6745_05215 [Candidatus Woesearchaeota archaeon]|nr:MAG: hypothetical protein D6745_05215 [Candidatus Woesearchaeota archaeon]